MKMRLILSLMLTILMGNVHGQSDIRVISQEIVENNLSLQMQEMDNEAAFLRNKEALLPEDPSVELGYLWGSPSSLGNRSDFNVGQSIKFPSYYSAKKKMNSFSSGMNDQGLIELKNEILHRIFSHLTELAYLADKRILLEDRLRRTKEIAALSALKVEFGESSRLEWKKLQLMVTQSQQKLRLLSSLETRHQRALQNLNAGQELKLPLLSLDSLGWFLEKNTNDKQLESSPSYLRSTLEQLRSKQALKVAKMGRLPDLYFGYRSEKLVNEKVGGVVLGLSLPLWGKGIKIKEASIEKSILELKNAWTLENLKSEKQIQSDIQSTATEMEEAYRLALQKNQSRDLLFSTYKEGEISLQTYLLELPYYYEVENGLLEARKERTLALIAKNRHWLNQLVIGF